MIDNMYKIRLKHTKLKLKEKNKRNSCDSIKMENGMRLKNGPLLMCNNQSLFPHLDKPQNNYCLD